MLPSGVGPMYHCSSSVSVTGLSGENLPLVKDPKLAAPASSPPLSHSTGLPTSQQLPLQFTDLHARLLSQRSYLTNSSAKSVEAGGVSSTGCSAFVLLMRSQAWQHDAPSSPCPAAPGTAYLPWFTRSWSTRLLC